MKRLLIIVGSDLWMAILSALTVFLVGGKPQLEITAWPVIAFVPLLVFFVGTSWAVHIPMYMYRDREFWRGMAGAVASMGLYLISTGALLWWVVFPALGLAL